MIQPVQAAGRDLPAAAGAGSGGVAPRADAGIDGLGRAAGPVPCGMGPHDSDRPDDPAPASVTVAEDRAESYRSWRRIAFIWAVAWHFALTVALVLVTVENRAIWLYPALAGLSASYLLLQHPWLLDRRGRRAADAHLVIVSVLCFAIIWGDPSLAFLAPVVLSQFSPHSGYRLRGIGLLAAAAAVLTLPIAFRDGLSGGSLLGWALSAGPALLINLFIGGFFVEMVNDNDRRGDLIRELEATRAELEQAHHDAGVLEERERLAQEIHDTLAQGFTSLLMLLQAAEATLDTDRETTRERLDLAARTARENLAEARALIGGDPTAGLPLDTALRRAAARIGEELGLATAVDIGGSPRPLTANVQVVTLRVAQEALANVRKHARADAVTLWLTYGTDRLTLAVEDDGVGMAEAPCDGFGMRSMRKRVEQVGGGLTITSAPGEGTRVEAEVPYE